MTKKTLSRCLTTIGMLAFAISMALPAAALEDRALPTYPCPKCGTTMTTSVETGYEFFYNAMYPWKCKCARSKML
ncbi:MAG: hypothetical protein ACLTSY_14865 [Subdoligranulum sp.]